MKQSDNNQKQSGKQNPGGCRDLNSIFKVTLLVSVETRFQAYVCLVRSIILPASEYSLLLESSRADSLVLIV